MVEGGNKIGTSKVGVAKKLSGKINENNLIPGIKPRTFIAEGEHATPMPPPQPVSQYLNYFIWHSTRP